MLSFIAKKLLKQPIGTQVEITIETEEGLRTLQGTITDSDFETGMELTTTGGELEYLDCTQVKNWRPMKAESAPAPQPAPQPVSQPAPKPEPKPEPGPEPKPEPVPQSQTAAPRWFQESPECCVSYSDSALKDLFKQIPEGDRRRLSSAYDSFQYGVKARDAYKISYAASQARTTLMKLDDEGYYWSTEAVLFCGALLYRAKTFDRDVYLVAECFREAAYCCWRKKEYSLASAYAILALSEENPENPRELMRLLYQGVTSGADVSGLDLFLTSVPASLEADLKELMEGLFRFFGKLCPAGCSLKEAALELKKDMPGTGTEEELLLWEYDLQIAEPEPESQPEQEEAPRQKENVLGIITRWDWSTRTGTVTDFYGNVSVFRPDDLMDPLLRRRVEESMRMDLGGEIHHVRYTDLGGTATKIQPDYYLVDRAVVLLSESFEESCPNRFVLAYDLCKAALSTKDVRRAITRLVETALKIWEKNPGTAPIRDAVSLYEQYSTHYSGKHFDLLNVAKCYCILKKYPAMMKMLDKAMTVTGVVFNQVIPLVKHTLSMILEYYNADGSSKLLRKMVEIAESVRRDYAKDLAASSQNVKTYYQTLGPLVIRACCLLDLPEQAADYLASMPERCREREEPELWVAELLEEHARKAREEAEAARKAAEEARKAEEEARKAAEEARTAALEAEDAAFQPEEWEEEEPEEEIPPYTDPDGWPALKLTARQVIDYALAIRHEQKIPYMTAYLRAGASLNPQIQPVYQNVALAVDDPQADPDYSITTLMSALENSNSAYPILNDYCLACAYLRASFQAGRGYDYTTQGLRSSIAVSQNLDALQEIYNLLEEFRKAVSVAVDIYADYRSHGLNRQKQELETVQKNAETLYTKYVLNPVREKSANGRTLRTKALLFSKGSYLAQMLQYIVEQDGNAMEGEKETFASRWLKNTATFSASQIDPRAVADHVDDAWDRAKQDGSGKRGGALFGSPRNSMVSGITEILTVICRWYSLTAQSASFSWRTEQGEEVYRRLKPQLLEQLSALERHCAEALPQCEEDETYTGLFLLADTARELAARLEGTWKLHQKKYLYADFLRGSQITLDGEFLPELGATFCILPEFNILKRLREHMEQEQPSFREQLQRIYGADQRHNNYGSALQIVEYLQTMEEDEEVSLPENAELFHAQTEMQMEMLHDSFHQRYGMALSYGQIIKSDTFCHTLTDTVRFWYAHCRATRNYGFFADMLVHAEEQIHVSARVYEAIFEDQLKSLIEHNQDYFDQNPTLAPAIRELIASQNFTVAENWMTRIRREPVPSLVVRQPEALKYLDQFWMDFTDNYESASLNGRSLADSIRRKGLRNKNTRWAQQLIDSWLISGRASNPDRIRQLLNLLGWQNIRVTGYPLPQDRTAEIYEVRKEFSSDAPIAPLHPIAAFGSNLETRPIYVSCLYGGYDCDKLLEKFRTLDAIDGDKIILLDYTLSQLERRSLARKLKKRESALRNAYIVIDRVLITFLANQFNPNLINRILMAVAMPFSYYQPYVVDSALTMPPEIFIGRTEELRAIEDPEGVNLIYGGRQLGKSALFKKAVADLDGRGGKRAVLIDINTRGCANAAKWVSGKLIDMGITPDAQETDDWDVLCRNIERRLRQKEDEISYFLLMLDEADVFISDCANCDYRPLVALKDLQQSMPRRFKYVLAGLHDVVRFNRQVALGNNSVIPHIPYLKVTPFQTPEAQELLTEPLSYLGFSLPSRIIVSQILATCNYFPGLIQLYARKLIESMRGPDYAGYDMGKTPPYIVSDEHLRRVIADKHFSKQIVEKFESTLHLGERDGNVYYPLTLLIGYLYDMAPSNDGYTARDLHFHATDLNLTRLSSLSVDFIDALLAELEELNILRSVSSNSYLLASKNFRDLLGSDKEITEKLEKYGGGKS